MYQTSEYDVIIMGAGLAGLCQARHLMLNIPSIKVALIDPRPEERTEKDLKLGESTVEVANLFLGKDLGLYEYLIENHPPKLGLNFHWPKNPAKTESIDDYYHIWGNRQPDMASTQLNRAKFERDLLKMNKEMGVHFYNGRVIDVDITKGDTVHTVKVKLPHDYLDLQCKHLVDTAGRRFIIGHKTDNVLFGPENLEGVNNGSAWVRVKNVDRTIFHSGYDPMGASCSHYYGTNHCFGSGHWLWMIPTDTQSMELSIGIIHHHDVISAQSLNTQEKFYEFLETNHNLLYQLVMSGEKIDFHYLPRIAHTSKTLYSADNWYVVGDSACIFDAFYSLGSTMIVSGIDSITEIIRSQLAQEPDTEIKRKAYNDFNLHLITSFNLVVSNHAKQLGHASLMSWRIYLENMVWFGIVIPLFIGKWHLDVKFIPNYVKTYENHIKPLFNDVHKQFNNLVEQDVNIGFMDCYRSDQLIWDYHPPKRYSHSLENAEYEPQKSNVFVSMKKTFFYLAIWYFKLQWKISGLIGVIKPKSIYHFVQLLSASAYISLGELIYLLQTRNKTGNSEVEQIRQQFTTYSYQNVLLNWSKSEEDSATSKIQPPKTVV